MFENITLIILSHYRHKYLDRVLDFYKDSGINIIVCDSSKDEYPNKSIFRNVNYLHYPDYPYSKKIFQCTKYLNTKYAILCADDDFIITSTIKKCIEFLENNEDYFSVQGHYINFFKRQGQIEFLFDPNYMELDFSNHSPSERVKQLFQNFASIYFSVQRTENIKRTFEYAAKFGINSLLIEFLMVIIAIINGKYKILPFFYYIRDGMSLRAWAFESMKIVSTSDKYKKERMSFIDITTDYLAKKENINRQKARKVILEAIEGRLNYAYTAYTKPEVKKSPVKEFIKNNMPFRKNLLTLYQKVYSVPKNRKRIYNNMLPLNLDNLAFKDEKEANQARRDLERVEYFIKKHKKLL